MFDVGLNGFSHRAERGQSGAVAVHTREHEPLGCQPAHMPSTTASHVEHGALRADEVRPAPHPIRRLTTAVHGLKTRPDSGGHVDHHVRALVRHEHSA